MTNVKLITFTQPISSIFLGLIKQHTIAFPFPPQTDLAALEIIAKGPTVDRLGPGCREIKLYLYYFRLLISSVKRFYFERLADSLPIKSVCASRHMSRRCPSRESSPQAERSQKTNFG